MLQFGGGACTLCGTPGTNKSTCPLNPAAKHTGAATQADAVSAVAAINRPAPAPARARTASSAPRASSGSVARPTMPKDELLIAVLMRLINGGSVTAESVRHYAKYRFHLTEGAKCVTELPINVEDWISTVVNPRDVTPGAIVVIKNILCNVQKYYNSRLTAQLIAAINTDLTHIGKTTSDTILITATDRKKRKVILPIKRIVVKRNLLEISWAGGLVKQITEQPFSKSVKKIFTELRFDITDADIEFIGAGSEGATFVVSPKFVAAFKKRRTASIRALYN